MDFVIAVDGPAASGKGTIASRLAAIYGLPYLDTGLLYRAVGWRALMAADFDAAAAACALSLDPGTLTDPALRSRAAGAVASRAAALSPVRDALLSFQRSFAARPGGAVLDGRDIGTVIAPQAAAKLFVTAAPEVRAERRRGQLAAEGEPMAFEAVMTDIVERDARDRGRAVAPLAMAADAVLLDTSEMDISEAVEAARRIVETARARWESSRTG